MRFALLCIFFFAALCVNALVVKKTVSVDGSEGNLFVQFDRFQFLKNGTLAMDLEYSKIATTRIMLCEEAEIVTINDKYETSDKFCNALTAQKFECTLMVSLPENEKNMSFVYNIPRKGMYYFLVENCKKDKFKIKMDYIMMNPNDQHLGYGHIPLPDLHYALSFVWGSLLGIWTINWLIYFRHPIKLHGLISWIPSTRFVCMYIAYNYWQTMSEEGEVPQDLLLKFHILGYGLSRFSFFLNLLAISAGWCVSRLHISYGDWAFLSIIVLLYAVFKALSDLVQQYFMFVVLILYIAIFRTILSNTSHNITLLKRERDFLTIHQYTGPTDSLRLKTDSLKSFQSAIMLFIFADIMISVCSVFFLYKMFWVQTMLEESIAILLFFRIG
eukprot:TRINITY_DN1683_c0_g2_i9.p1 TRINITY_DN1683_c0_g2~~TRINITY_DN1683_c0_g2_i9.p1  ORF type:complete len:386 (+),score=56.01 TRINITY_DN1683_c0_g2_i9:53-1210(+)